MLQSADVNPQTGLQAITIRGPLDRVREAYDMVITMFDRFDPRRSRPPPTNLGVPSSRSSTSAAPAQSGSLPPPPPPPAAGAYGALPGDNR